ncbi:MAG: hypothetical protein KGL42_08650 [Betaproteobacteria bacterium]|nr:hypothetical protein [Betaproteobacteria bacterium]
MGTQEITRSMPQEQPGRRGFVALPRAEVRARKIDSRWCYAYSFATHLGGHGFAPLPKWGHFADTGEKAVRAAAAALIDKVRKNYPNDAESRLICAWAQTLLHGEQIDLFEEMAA